MCRQQTDVDEKGVIDGKSHLSIILLEYSDRSIYNPDETELFFRALSAKTLMEKIDEANGAETNQIVTYCGRFWACRLIERKNNQNMKGSKTSLL